MTTFTRLTDVVLIQRRLPFARKKDSGSFVSSSMPLPDSVGRMFCFVLTATGPAVSSVSVTWAYWRSPL